VRNKHPEQKIAFVIDKKSKDYKKMANLGKVIQFGGFSHWFWYLVASKNIGTSLNSKPNFLLCYNIETRFGLRKKNRVLLQDRIDEYEEFLNYKNNNLFRLAVSSFQEQYNLNSNFGYPKEAVCLTGLCRFDQLVKNKSNNKIVVVPSWRNWFENLDEMKKFEGTNNLAQTQYFNSWQNFLNNEKLNLLLEKHNKELVFCVHKNMKNCSTQFKSNFERIKIKNVIEFDSHEFCDASMLLTDYSKICEDFAFMKKPIIFYQFDEFKVLKHKGFKGNLNYKNNIVSDWCDNEKDLLNLLENLLKANIKNEKVDFNDEYFAYRDNLNCERNYQMIKFGKVLEKKE